MGEEGLAARLGKAQTARYEYPLLRRLMAAAEVGRVPIVAETCRPPGGSPRDVAEAAALLLEAGADAVAVRTGSADTPDGMADLTAASREIEGRPALRGSPLFMRDWVLHPLQLVDAVDAGATGVIGIVAQVTGPKGALSLGSFGAALGLDTPVEVVNAQEAEALAAGGAALFAINTSVGLTVSIPGFKQSVTRGIIRTLPFGCAALVGCATVDDARAARAAEDKCDAVFVRAESFDGLDARGVRDLLEGMQYAMSGDD